MRVVFVHGAGSAGADAWPNQTAQAGEDWQFLGRHSSGDDARRDAARVLGLLRVAGGGHVVAHSYGANAAVLAAQREPSLVRSLTLLEPACFDLARGCPAVEDHIAAMTPVFAVSDDPSVSTRDFSRRFAAGMGFEPPDVSDEELTVRVGRLRALLPPWGIGLEVADLPVPTMVVTGGWSDLYEEAASALVRLGARHAVVEGARHRVQDVPETDRLLREHWRVGSG